MLSEMPVETGRISRNSVESLYSKWDGEKFARLFETGKSLPPAAQNAYQDFYAHIAGENFSCVGAKAALRGEIFRFGFYREMNAPESNRGLAQDLRSFAAEQKDAGSNYASFAAIFDASVFDNEKHWEIALWKQIENLHLLDGDSIWDPAVSSDPEDVDFSFSFAGTGFFIVGLHPHSSRLARRFSRAAMVFNPHAQFDRLREIDQYERLQKTIRARELKIQGSLNPNLSDFGAASEARQYSGRALEENWKCPFHARMRQTKESEK